MKLKNLYDETTQQVMNPEYGMEDLTYGVPTEYAIGGRAGYEEGAPIYSRLGELNTGVSSAEQQLQQINQSIEQAQSTLGSAESGGGGASAVTPSVSGYESSGSDLYDSSPAGEVTNPYQAPVGMDNEGIVNKPAITAPTNPYDYGGGLGGLLGEGGGGTISNTMAPREPGQPIPDKPLGIYNKGEESFGNIMQATPSTGGGPSLTQTAISGGGVMPRPGPAIDPNNPLLQLQNSMNAGKLPGNNTLQAAADSGGGLAGMFGSFAPGVDPMGSRKENPLGPLQQLADGGIAGLRQGYAGGGGIDIARRGFLKFLGGTAAGVAALKAGLVKILGKESGAISKKVIDEVIIEGGSGAPAWLQPLVNKALREGTDISKQAVKDGQVVKSLDTPTGKVDVYYDTRSGEIDIDYIGGNTALGESVNMRYTPGIADEGTKGVKPADEFEAVERIPEQTMFGVDDYELTMGENAVGDVKGLYSDTSELAELGGEKLLIKDISESIKKKKVLKQMGEDPTEFATEGYSTGQYYDPT